jgi:glutathione S-transferase
MKIKFYYGSGSPFAWYVWLVLEHKQLKYDISTISLRSGELKQPGYLSINPHGKVPALIDDGFVLWEASTIVEYLEERYTDLPLIPKETKQRAIARRYVAEGYSYLYPIIRRIMELTLMRADGDGDYATIKMEIVSLGRELDYFENAILNDYFLDAISISDFAIYPLLALVKRIHEKRPLLGAGDLIKPRLAAFMNRIEALPYFAVTTPPHWKG